MVVRRTRRRPPRRTLGSSPRWSRRQSVERDTPNAWIASPIVSRFVDIARSYHGSLTVSLVSFQRGQVPPRVRSHCSSRVPQVSRCSRPGWWQLRRECPSLENRQTWGTQRGAPWVTSDCNGRHHYQVFFWFQIRTGAHSKCQGTTEEQMQSIDKTVHQFYAARGISPLRFTCEHYSNCRNGCRTFAQAREPFIGRRYGEHGAPRLLFVSSNPPKGDMAGESRTIQAVRRSEETECHQDLPKQLHWYRTHEFAWRLLQHVLPKLDIENSCQYFAHTNSAKCTTNKPGGREGPGRLFHNCQEYLRGEVTAFRPDILVTQGKKAQCSIEQAFPKFKERNSQSLGCGYRTFQVDDYSVLWIHTTHPSAYGTFNRERKDFWDYWVNVARRFLKTSRGRVASPSRV